ncbi:MAG: ATP-binding protein [Thermoplasmatales archaeon]|nr:ATP-binding protein [Thermoplasmatales archaeon]MCW6170386.1 ATP-binding protein [Thermoplasmatales archaeon]
MNRKRDFYAVISDYILTELPKAVERDLSIPKDTTFIISIAGPRRAGKTFIMYNTIDTLKKIIPKNNILYVNFEHEKLRRLDASDLSDLLTSFYELAKPQPEKDIYLFLDEIQIVNGWSAWVNRIYESKRFHIFLSGSSSKLLGRELSTELRGRSIDFVVLPLSFKEFIRIKELGNIGDLEAMLHSEERGKILEMLREYAEFGGFPEVALNESYKLNLLKSYVDTIILKDVGERFRVEPSILRVFLEHSFESYSKYFSGSKTYNFLKGINYSVSHETPLKLLSYFEEVFALFHLEIFSRSFRSRKSYPRKLYVVDTGLINAVLRSRDWGRLIENIVFVELYRRSKDFSEFSLNYWKEYGKAEGMEVDFVISRGGKVIELLNVSYASSTADLPSREVKSLRKGSKELGSSRLSIITWDLYGSTEEGDIQFIPLWYWLLRQNNSSDDISRLP